MSKRHKREKAAGGASKESRLPPARITSPHSPLSRRVNWLTRPVSIGKSKGVLVDCLESTCPGFPILLSDFHSSSTNPTFRPITTFQISNYQPK